MVLLSFRLFFCQFMLHVAYKSVAYFYNHYLTTPQPTLNHLGDSLTHPMLITAFFKFGLEGHREPRNEVGLLSPVERLVGFELRTFLLYNNAFTHLATLANIHIKKRVRDTDLELSEKCLNYFSTVNNLNGLN